MFGNLIESGSHAADLKRKGRFFLATTAFYGLLLAAAGVGSVYAYNARLDYDPEYELVSLLRFPPVVAAPDKPRNEARAASSPARSNQIAVRTELSTQTPYHGDRIASRVTPETPHNMPVAIGNYNFTPEEIGGPVGPSHPGSTYSSNNTGPAVTDNTIETPPPPVPTRTPTPQPSPKPEGPVRLTSSLITSKAIEKPAPPYPPIAKMANQQGTVAVQIVIDEQGHVISAKALSGPPLLMQAAVQAAYRARFTPTILGGQPVKVTGSISYNFVLH